MTWKKPRVFLRQDRKRKKVFVQCVTDYYKHNCYISLRCLSDYHYSLGRDSDCLQFWSKINHPYTKIKVHQSMLSNIELTNSLSKLDKKLYIIKA